MKTVWIVAWTLLFVSVAGFADSPSPGPVSDEALATILGEPLAGASCATKAGEAEEIGFVAAVTGKTITCEIDCMNGNSVSCTSNVSCTKVQRNCVTALEPGHVTCYEGSSATCPACCTGGTLQQNACCRCNVTGSCMDCCRCEGGTLSQCAAACS